MTESKPVSIQEAFKKVKFLENRTPETSDIDAKEAFAKLSEYRDGGVFIAHYAGNSEWERHPKGDELVLVIEGETTLILLSNNVEIPHRLGKHELLVVPRNMWHRFETPLGVKVMAVTPQPTDHSFELPKST